ncbi:MAG: hypothetical protein EOP53_25615, partial [Sphingobacteriales bacterium]
VAKLNNFRFRSIIFFDENYGWITGDNGILLGTTDGGETWNILHSPQDIVVNPYVYASTYNLIALSQAELLACNNVGTIKSTDGGKTWTQIGTYNRGTVGWITRKSDNEYFGALKTAVNGNTANMLYSNDGCKTWQELDIKVSEMDPSVERIYNFNGKFYANTRDKHILKYMK